MKTLVNPKEVASEHAITEAKDFATEFMVNELGILRRTLEDGEIYASDTSMRSKYDENIVGNLLLASSGKELSLDMYVFIPKVNKPEVIFLTFTRSEGVSTLLFSSESLPKPNDVPVDMVPAFVSLENLLIELGL